MVKSFKVLVYINDEQFACKERRLFPDFYSIRAANTKCHKSFLLSLCHHHGSGFLSWNRLLTSCRVKKKPIVRARHDAGETVPFPEELTQCSPDISNTSEKIPLPYLPICVFLYCHIVEFVVTLLKACLFFLPRRVATYLFLIPFTSKWWTFSTFFTFSFPLRAFIVFLTAVTNFVYFRGFRAFGNIIWLASVYPFLIILLALYSFGKGRDDTIRGSCKLKKILALFLHL